MFIIKKIMLWFAKRRAKRQYVHYIHGPQGLPAPLDPEREHEAMETLSAALLRGDDIAAERVRGILIEHNLRLVVYIARKFENSGTNIEDLISIGTIGLIKAINTFRPDKLIKLATYASRCIENEILMHLRRLSGKSEISFDEPLNTDRDGNELLLSDILGSDGDEVFETLGREEEVRAVRESLAGLDERDREIITLRYGLAGGRDLTQREVADKLGISQSYISRLEKKIMSDLKGSLQGKI